MFPKNKSINTFNNPSSNRILNNNKQMTQAKPMMPMNNYAKSMKPIAPINNFAKPMKPMTMINKPIKSNNFQTKKFTPNNANSSFNRGMR